MRNRIKELHVGLTPYFCWTFIPKGRVITETLVALVPLAACKGRWDRPWQLGHESVTSTAVFTWANMLWLRFTFSVGECVEKTGLTKL
jgi:hypothetical protein